MRRRARILAAVAALALALGPAIAEARPGGGSSSGSRGSRTQSAPPATQTAPQGAQQFDRTAQPPAAPAASRPSPTYTPQAANRGGMFGGGFMAGLAGGLLGAGIAGMLFGGGAFGGLSGAAGFIGFLLQIALIAGLVWLVVRLVRGRRAPAPALAGAGPGMPPANAYARDMMDGDHRGTAHRAVSRSLVLSETDFAEFERALIGVNAAWLRQDMNALRRLSTPEMVGYFEQDLRDLAARGWRNETRDIRLEAGDLSESWHEDGQDYATVAMRFSLVDVTRDSAGAVVEGDPDRRQTTTELWTFVRRPGTAWTLSAIQQTGR